MKKLLSLICCCVVVTLCRSQQPGTPRPAAGPLPGRTINMDASWKFSLTDTAGADKAGFSDSQWRTLDLPHDWSIEGGFDSAARAGGGGGYLPTGVGWYRKHFILPKEAAGKIQWIEFEGVYQNSDVWINGHHLGHYPNGYMSFYYDLSPYTRKGENIISVRVDNSLQPNSRWYSGSGIYRHVWLHIADRLHVARWGTYITIPAVDSAAAEVVVRTSIENKNEAAENAVLRLIVTDSTGREVARMESPFSVAGGKTQELEQKMTVRAPLLWSLETPVLYTLHSQLLTGHTTVDAVNNDFGIRTIRYDADSGFLLNGRRVKMKGVCLHQDAGSVGSAVPEAMWVRRLQILKEMGCNAIRTSHNPEAPEWLDLCDRMGFLVMDEIFDEWTSGKVKYGYHTYFNEWSQPDLVGFIHRDRNHPSVVMWSAGNEIGEQKQEDGDKILGLLITTFHREDPTRPVTTANDEIAADNGSARLPFLKMLDIVGYNYMDRWHERRELFTSVDRHDHPDWKMVGTESVSIPGVRGQAPPLPAVIRAEQLWKFVSLHDYIIGDFMWTGIDYLGESRWPNKNAGSGVIDLCGFPKDGYYFYQSQWTDKPMIHFCTDWNPAGKEGKVIPVIAFTNCDSVELFVNGKSFGIKCLQFPRPGNSGAWNRYDRRPVGITTGDLHLEWDVPYEPGLLRAVGRKGGRIVDEQTIHTTGAPAAIRLTSDRTRIQADGRDVAQVKIEVLDKDGYPVPDAGNNIVLSVEGAGHLIGLDNGDPMDHTSMKSNRRNVFHGLALGVIQSSAQPGVIRVQASSPGIAGATIEIRTQMDPARSQPAMD
jgi:beta-galactosidase